MGMLSLLKLIGGGFCGSHALCPWRIWLSRIVAWDVSRGEHEGMVRGYCWHLSRRLELRVRPPTATETEDIALTIWRHA